MIFKSVRWKNLLSYGKTWTKMRLDTNETINIVGINGTGKSTFVEAIFLALTGKPLRKVRKEQMVNILNKKNCVVELEVSSGKHTYKIIRGIKPNVFKIEKDGEPMDESSMMMDSQSYLEMVLGFTKKNLKHTLIMSTTDYTPFLRLAAADKRLFIEDILAIEIFSVMNKLIKAKLSILKDDIRDNQTDIEKLQYKLNMVLEYNKQQRQTNDEEIAQAETDQRTEKKSMAADIESYRVRTASSIEDVKKKSLAGISNEKAKLKTDINDLKQKAADLKIELADLKEKSKDLDRRILDARTNHGALGEAKHVIFDEMVGYKEKYEADIQKWKDNIDKGSKARFKVSVKISNLDEKIENYPDTAHCENCDQEIDPKFRQEKIDGIADEIAELQKRHEKIEAELEKVNAFKERAEQYKIDKVDPLDAKCKKFETEMSDLLFRILDDESKLKVLESKQEACRKQMAEFKSTNQKLKEDAKRRIAGYEDTEGPISKLNAQFDADLEKAAKDTQRRLDALQTKIDELKSEKRGKIKDEKKPSADVDAAELQKKRLAFDKMVHDTAILILSDKGIKTYIIKRYIPKLNSFVNQYLEILSASYKLSFTEELEEKIALKGYDKLSYNNFSEGERQRCDIALLFAFLDIGKMKNSVTSNLLIMDEIFDRSLDDDGIRGIINIINSMKEKGFTIANISHKHQLADQFDVTYRATKDQFSDLNKI